MADLVVEEGELEAEATGATMRGEEAIVGLVLLWEAEDGQVCGVGQMRETVGLSRRWGQLYGVLLAG